MIGLITDDEFNYELTKLAAKLQKDEMVVYAYPKKRSMAKSCAVTVDVPVSFKETLFGPLCSVEYDGFPADAFIYLLQHYKVNRFVFGPNDTTHSGVDNIVSSTVSLMLLARFMQIPAFSISVNSNEGRADLKYDFQFENYRAYNLFDNDTEPIEAEPVRFIKDSFNPVHVEGRDTSNKFWLSYTHPEANEEGTDAYYEQRHINYFVDYLKIFK